MPFSSCPLWRAGQNHRNMIQLYMVVMCMCFLGVISKNNEDILGTGICGTRPAAANPSLRIYGGTATPSGQWPWIGSMHLGDHHFCGCTLLSDEWAVTAAHCVADYMTKINDITLHFGITNVKTLVPIQHHVARSILGVVVNPNSRDTGNIRNNDIALLHLSSPVYFTDYVRPACVQIEDNELEYGDCWVAGWGALGTATDLDPEKETFPDVLQQVKMPIVTEETCRRDEYRWSDTLSDDMLCAGDSAEYSACQGDSGGPLVCRDNNHRWNLVGIVSWGRSVCQDKDPSVFCRVSRFADFIRASTQKYQDYGGDISLDTTSSTHLTSHGFPQNYDEFTYLAWTVTAPRGYKIHATFDHFDLQREDFLFIGVEEDSRKLVKYTGDKTPPDLISTMETMYVSFVSDVTTTGTGMNIILSSTNRTDYQVCANGIEIITPDQIQDGFPDCYDRSDELSNDAINVADCGVTSDLYPVGRRKRVAGGTAVEDTSDWPWIGVIEDYLSEPQCACTLLNDKWALTTVSCIIELGDHRDSARVKFGVTDVSDYSWIPSGEHETTRSISRTILNPDWEYIFDDATLKTNNLALVELSTPVQINEFVRPVCLATSQDESKDYRNCKIAGFGEDGSLFSLGGGSLREASIPLISSENCRSDKYDIGSLIVSDDMICAGGATSRYPFAEARGICPGDAASPLVCEDTRGISHLVGIASLGGEACSIDYDDLDNKVNPDVYSRISWQLPFLTFGIKTGQIPCRSDQFRCDDGQCIPSRWAKCNVTSECKDGSDEHGCEYCPKQKIHMSVNSTVRLHSIGYPNGYKNDECSWTVIPASKRRVMVHIVDLGLDYSTKFYIGTLQHSELLSFSGSDIPKLRLLSMADEVLHFHFQPSSYSWNDPYSSNPGFSLLFTDIDDQGQLQYCSNGLEVYDSYEDDSSCQDKHSEETPPDGHHCYGGFQCDSGECIYSGRCDGHSFDCRDDSDEIGCNHPKFEYDDDYNSGGLSGSTAGIIGGVLAVFVGIPLLVLKIYCRAKRMSTITHRRMVNVTI